MTSEKNTIARIIRKHGALIDLRKNPEVMIEILRKFADDLDGGSPPGGTPPSPPGPTSFQDRVTNEDLLRSILSLTRQIKATNSPATQAKTSKKAR